MAASKAERTAKAVKKFRKGKSERAREQTAKAVKKYRRIGGATVRPRLAIRVSCRLRCKKCGQPDPAVVRTLKRTKAILKQIMRCRRCNERWTNLAD